MRSSIVFVAMTAVAMTGCAHGTDRMSSTPKTASATLLVPIAAGSYGSLVDDGTVDAVAGRFKLPPLTPLNEEDKIATARIRGICDTRFDGSRGGGESALLGIVGALIKPLFGFLFHKADKAIDAKLEGYKAEWSAGVTAALFRSDSSGKVEPAYRCMRLLRVSEQPESKDDVATIQFDAIFAVHWVPASNAWQLVPLRVMTGDPVARGDEVKFAASIAGTSAIVSDGVGDTKTIPEMVVLKGAYDVTADTDPTQGKRKVAYPVKACDLINDNLVLPNISLAGASQMHPLRVACESDEGANSLPKLVPSVAALAITGNLPTSPSTDGSASTIVIKVAEAGEGARKARLEDWKAFLGKAGDGMSDALTTAISELVAGKKSE